MGLTIQCTQTPDKQDQLVNHLENPTVVLTHPFENHSTQL